MSILKRICNRLIASRGTRQWSFARFLNILFCLCIGTVLSVMLIDWYISQQAGYLCFDEIDNIPYKRVGILLGTAKYVARGRMNQYYVNRIEAVRKLFQAGKIDYIVISGDNSTRSYDEPSTIKTDLIRYGVPEAKIYRDYAGFRTLDSVVRAHKVFGLDDFTVISQRFHNERAIYIAQHLHLNVIGFNARDVGAYYGLRTKMREKIARIVAFWDVHISHKQPKFLGPRIIIGESLPS